tara:strand:- start:811 stop:1044 length:234 start_codon:yes stop_codon:yes gene_type:complete
VSKFDPTIEHALSHPSTDAYAKPKKLPTTVNINVIFIININHTKWIFKNYLITFKEQIIFFLKKTFFYYVKYLKIKF